jgi:cytochrome c
MKKTFLSIAVLAFFACGITSCGGKQEKEGAEEEEYNEYGSAQEEGGGQNQESPEALIQQGQALVDASDCKTCHHLTNKIIGPPHQEVATKYEFSKENVTYLAGKIINGGSGVWGEIPMTPHADLSQADAEKMAMYVLSLDGEKPNF